MICKKGLPELILMRMIRMPMKSKLKMNTWVLCHYHSMVHKHHNNPNWFDHNFSYPNQGPAKVDWNNKWKTTRRKDELVFFKCKYVNKQQRWFTRLIHSTIESLTNNQKEPEKPIVENKDYMKLYQQVSLGTIK